MNPVILYVDDEPNNLTVFEAALPENWKIVTLDQPVQALDQLDRIQPWVIVSDQRMPGMSGVQFLEICRKILPHSVRIIATGYSDENLIVESVRKAQIFDYIKKPWDVADLESSLRRASEFFRAAEDSRRLQAELIEREKELRTQTEHLRKLSTDLQTVLHSEEILRKELECWIPPVVVWALKEKQTLFPLKKDLICIAFDIIESSRLHGIEYQGRPIRSQILQLFSEAIIRHGGWRETTSGDSAYGHFGLSEDVQNPTDAALSAAREFRVSLRGLSETTGIPVECGIGLHLARKCTIDIHTTQISTHRGLATQKAFETIAPDIDLLHRMEKLAHTLPGTNIIFSRPFMNLLKHPPDQALSIGTHLLKGQKEPVELWIIKSDRVTATDLERLKHSGLNIENSHENAPPLAA